MQIGPFTIDRDQPPLTPEESKVVRQFHELYYQRWANQAGDTIRLSWFGYELLKCPLDLWMYQELIVRRRPNVLVETGTFRGGSALFFAMLFDHLNHGKVVTIDIEPQPNRPFHPRIQYLTGSSTDPAIIDLVVNTVGSHRAMVVLDSDHRQEHVYEELVAYSPLVRTGDYIVVEDTNVNGHPSFCDFGPGPMEAVARFLSERDDFEADNRCERFLMTLYPNGYLKRVRVN